MVPCTRCQQPTSGNDKFETCDSCRSSPESDCSVSPDRGSIDCYDSPPPQTRPALTIASELVIKVDCNHRPLACEASRSIKEMWDELRKSRTLIAAMERELSEPRLVFFGENAQPEKESYQAGQQRMIDFVKTHLSK